MKIAELLIGFGAGMAVATVLAEVVHRSIYSDMIDPHEYSILIGPKDMPQCSQEVPLSIWDSMNELQVWRWSVACVEKYKESNKLVGYTLQ